MNVGQPKMLGTTVLFSGGESVFTHPQHEVECHVDKVCNGLVPWNRGRTVCNGDTPFGDGNWDGKLGLWGWASLMVQFVLLC